MEVSQFRANVSRMLPCKARASGLCRWTVHCITAVDRSSAYRTPLILWAECRHLWNREVFLNVLCKFPPLHKYLPLPRVFHSFLLNQNISPQAQCLVTNMLSTPDIEAKLLFLPSIIKKNNTQGKPHHFDSHLTMLCRYCKGTKKINHKNELTRSLFRVT